MLTAQPRTRRLIDENAPPALRSTRSSTTTATLGSKPATTSTAAKRSTTTDIATNVLASSKIPKPVVTRTKSSTTTTTTTSAAGIAGSSATQPLRSRAALGDRTNAAKREATAGKLGEKGAKALAVKEDQQPVKRKATTVATTSSRLPISRPSSRSTTASSSTVAHDAKPLVDRKANGASEKTNANEPARKKRKTSSPVTVAPADDPVHDDLDDGHYDVDGKEILLSSGGKPVGLKSPKRARAKDEGWEDLDAEDEGDPSMVSEYVVDAFNYMMRIEHSTMPNPDYMDDQTEIQWKMRTMLMEWLIEVHQKFRLLPETLFVAVNLVDRFLSRRVISLAKFQLVGLTAIFIASKYEEIVCPSLSHFLHMAEGGFSVEEVLKAERYMLSSIDFDLSYPNPIHFLRRISKADAYDIQVRTVAKFLVEVSAVEHTLMPFPPSQLAAGAMFLARMCLERGPWNANLVHYSTYAIEELIEAAQCMLDYLLDPELNLDSAFFKKYASKKHMKASTFMHDWVITRWPKSWMRASAEVGRELYVEFGLDAPDNRFRVNASCKTARHDNNTESCLCFHY